MQDAGSLRKRRRRNLGKVIGLGTKQYDAKTDVFDINVVLSALGGSKYVDKEAQHSAKRPTRDKSLTPLSSRGLKANPETTDTVIEINILPREQPIDRICLVSNRSITRLRWLVTACVLSFTLPWSWNKKTFEFDVWKGRGYKIWVALWFIWAVQSGFMFIFQIYSFMQRLDLDADGSYRTIFVSSCNVCWYCYIVCSKVVQYQYREPMRCYINTLLNFNRKYVERFVVHLDGLGEEDNIVNQMTIPLDIAQSIISCVFFAKYPMAPIYLYSYIYSPDNPSYWLIPGIIQEWFAVGHTCLTHGLVSWIIINHCNSVEFWISETHNNSDSSYTTDDIRHPQRVIGVYRSLQVLTRQVNETIAPLAHPLHKFINWLSVVIWGYVLVRSMNHKFLDEFPASLTYPVGVMICGGTAYACLQRAAQMSDISQSFLDSWSKTQHSNLRRLLVSCNTLQLYLRRFYYITVSTTITYFMISVDYIVNCILTFP